MFGAYKKDILTLEKWLESGTFDLPELYTEEASRIANRILLEKRTQNDKIKNMEQSMAERDAFQGDLQRIRIEHHLAERIQNSLLPNNADEIKKKYPVDLYADMDTAWEIGGDYYDYFPIDEDRLFFSIADVSGKGVPAAIFSTVVKTVMKMSLLGKEPLERICEKANHQLYISQHGDSRMFATLWAGILNTQNGMLEYVNAGHEPPLLLHTDGEITLCEAFSGLPISAYFSTRHPEKNKYCVHHIKLNHGDALLLYTDGINEAADQDGHRFSIQRIMGATKAAGATNTSIKDWCKYIQRQVISFANHTEQDDDITVLGIRYL